MSAWHQRFNKWHLPLIAAIAIIVRIIYGFNLSTDIFINSYHLDSLVLHSWALDILNGTTANLAFFRAPLYPYLLALLYKLFSVSPWPVIIFQNLLGVLTAIISYKYAKFLFGSRVAFWSGIVVAIYPTLLIFEGETMITTLEVFLYTLAIYLMHLAVERLDSWRIVIAGIALGLAAITRPIILPLAIILPVALLIKMGRKSLMPIISRSVIFGLAAIVPILPVTLTNIIKGNEFALISTQGGSNFYIGNCKDADGITVVALGPQMRIGKYNDNIWTSSIDEAERRTGKTMTQSEISSFWYGEAFKYIERNLGTAAGLFLKKIYYFWHGQEIFNIKSLYYSRGYSWLIAGLLWKNVINFPTGILFPLMFLGIYFSIRNRKEIFIPIAYLALLCLIVSLYFICARFRQPVMPIAIIFGAYSIAEIINSLKSGMKKVYGALGMLMVLLVALNLGGNIDSKENLSQSELTIGKAYLNKNNVRSAISHFEKSLEILPDNLGVFDLLGKAYLESGMIGKAEEIYSRGAGLFPEYPLFNFGLGRISQMHANFGRALDFYYNTIKYAPDYAPAIEQIAVIYEHQGLLDSAIQYYRLLYRILPENPRVKNRLQNEINELLRKVGSGNP